MANILQAPRGTADVLPGDVEKWNYVEKVVSETARSFGFSEIRFPTFEYTELFSRGVGDTTDVVQKEMYTFEDRGGRSITLRPEGTACTVRALLQNGLHNGPLPRGLFYLVSCFRGEKPQAGRLREFHQFGTELFGTAAPEADAEIISLAYTVFKKLGVRGLNLEINSIGCPECRKNYHKALINYFSSHRDELCETCNERLLRNPMRILDCKSPRCKEIAAKAPTVLDYICDDCRAHFESVKKRLSALEIGFKVNPTIVRGLDYYTRTVFEFVDPELGLTACGGGRYDGLVKTLGGPSLPALGFGMGLERLIMIMEKRGCTFAIPRPVSIFLASIGENASEKAANLAVRLRQAGLTVFTDLSIRSIKAQLKFADKLGVDYVLAIGDDELNRNTAGLKRMSDGKTVELPLDGTIADEIFRAKNQ